MTYTLWDEKRRELYPQAIHFLWSSWLGYSCVALWDTDTVSGRITETDACSEFLRG